MLPVQEPAATKQATLPHKAPQTHAHLPLNLLAFLLCVVEGCMTAIRVPINWSAEHVCCCCCCRAGVQSCSEICSATGELFSLRTMCSIFTPNEHWGMLRATLRGPWPRGLRRRCGCDAGGAFNSRGPLSGWERDEVLGSIFQLRWC